MDKTLLLFINREWTNPFLDRLMAIFTNFDVWMPILVLAVLILLWRGKFKVRSFVIVTLLSLALTDGLFTQFMKKIVNRPRPSQALAEVREVSLEKTKPAILGVWRPIQVSLSEPPEGPVIGRSFPSGHAMNNSVIATLAVLFFGRLGLLYAIPTALVSYSRIYCGSHWPSDVVVSIILGVGFSLVFGSLANLIYQRLASEWFPKFYQRRQSLFGAN
ncbi:MAG TPA: phosphatase PAP2 family protein [Chthoniobacterales bacterium]|nr:phosphatase PAP2 family protein [Chthoniobacterales bacterium]